MSQATPPGMNDTASAPQAPPRVSVLAVTSLVLALIGVCTLVPALVGVVLGVIALVVTSGQTPKRRGKGLAIAGVLLSIVAILGWAALAALMLPALGKAREVAYSVHTATRIRMATMSLHLYAAENHGHLPAASGWQQALVPDYVNNLKELQGSQADHQPPLVFNAALSGRETDGSLESDLVLVFEGAYGSPPAGGAELLPNPPIHASVVQVGFVDGHAESMNLAAAAKLRWKPGKPAKGTMPTEESNADGSVRIISPTAPNVDANADDYAKGTAYFSANDFDKAIYHFEKFVKENSADPRCAEARYRIAKSYDDRPNPDTTKALAAWREYKSTHIDDDATRIRQANKRIMLLSGVSDD